MLRFLLIVVLASQAVAWSWGTDNCISPSHPGRIARRTDHVEVVTDNGLLHISAKMPIKGFLINGPSLTFYEAPEHSKIRDICGTPYGAITHTNNIPRDSVQVRFRCQPGLETADLNVYVVFGYRVPYVSLSGVVRCPQESTTVTNAIPEDVSSPPP
jgi:hypothetical protein